MQVFRRGWTLVVLGLVVARALSLDAQSQSAPAPQDDAQAVREEMAQLKKAFDMRLAALEERLKAVEGGQRDRKSTRLNSSHIQKSRMPSSA